MLAWFANGCLVPQAIVTACLQCALLLAAAASHPLQLLMLGSWSPSLHASPQSLQASPNWMGCKGQPPSVFLEGAAAVRVGKHRDPEVFTTAVWARSPEDKLLSRPVV